MTDEQFLDQLKQFCKKYNNTDVRVKQHEDSGVVQILNDKATPIKRAKLGSDEIMELACATAEHHPYWDILYHCTQITETVLGEWNGKLNKDQIEEMNWLLSKTQDAINRVAKS